MRCILQLIWYTKYSRRSHVYLPHSGLISTPSHQLLSKFYLTMSNGGVNVLLAINNLYGN
jgi:hypothetical protein